MDLPRSTGMQIHKFSKPVTVDVVLKELLENAPIENDIGTITEVEPDVTLAKGRRFCFVFSEHHKYYFLFVECDSKDVDTEYYASRPVFQDYILMDVYSIIGGGRRVKCVSVECCILLWSVIQLQPFDVSTDLYKFPTRLMKSDGEPGFIDTMWQYMEIELRNPDFLSRCVYKICKENRKFIENMYKIN